MILGHQSRPGKDDFTDLQVMQKDLKNSWPTYSFCSDVCGKEAIDAIEV